MATTCIRRRQFRRIYGMSPTWHVYTLFRACFNMTADIWLDLGLRGIDFTTTTTTAMRILYRLPEDIVRMVVAFMPVGRPRILHVSGSGRHGRTLFQPLSFWFGSGTESALPSMSLSFGSRVTLAIPRNGDFATPLGELRITLPM